uniref:Protein kinase domain-containing protein n=1 Tax=viral metagenome TaxID=1070528 RepID=A0A6C0E2D1_9ZZZZ
MKIHTFKHPTPSRNKTRKTKGGKVIGSGGFGCIFRPALKCKTQKRKKNQTIGYSDQVTKLMTVNHAKKEYVEITKYNNILDKIPNYKNYFLLGDVTLCEPDELTHDDLKNYKEKCKALNKKGITEGQINTSLNQVLALNMPNGGIDIESFLETNPSKQQLLQLNRCLIQLLNKAIIPMNTLHVYHCDIKDSNVLVENIKDTSMYTRLIDWGLSTRYSGEHRIPHVLTRRPFQFNVPFSIILFTSEFIQYYNDFLKKHETPDYFMIREFVINYIFAWIDIRGKGHLKTINKIMIQLFINDIPVIHKNKRKNFIVYDFTYYYIIEYISRILEKYTYDKKFHLYEYFSKVFIKNIDIWGFVMIYLPILERLHDTKDKMSQEETNMFKTLKYIFVHFLFETPVDPIDTSKLIQQLNHLNL